MTPTASTVLAAVKPAIGCVSSSVSPGSVSTGRSRPSGPGPRLQQGPHDVEVPALSGRV